MVDDNPANLEILETRLTRQGYEVITARDGDEALVAARAQTPDLILLDVMMPGKDGIQVCRELKADQSLPFMPVILVTAKADPDDIVAGLDAGGDEYITKPVDHAALVARVRSILRIKALHDTVREQAAQLEEWNRTLEQRVAAQLAQIDRLGALKRFLSPQVAELIVSAGDERLLESHRREITVVFCDLRGFTAFAETSEPEEVMGVLRQYHEALGELIFRHEGRSSILPAMASWCCSTIPCPAPIRPRARCAWRSRCAHASPNSPKLAQAGPRARLRRRHRPGLRHAGHDRIRGPVRLRGDRSGRQSRLAPVRRSRQRRHPDQPARARDDRGSGRSRAGGRSDAQGLHASRHGVSHPAPAPDPT